MLKNKEMEQMAAGEIMKRVMRMQVNTHQQLMTAKYGMAWGATHS
jgi:hypothetical protein